MRPHVRPSAYRALLHNRPFVALWLGQTISRFGDALYDLALVWYVLDTTGSALAASGIAIAAVGGRFAGSLVAGMVLDRLPARRVMLAMEALRCTLTAALGAGWLLGYTPSLALLYALACALAFGGALFMPARLAAIPQLVARESLVTANALDELSTSLVSTLAWGASGAIVALLGPARGLLIDAATFLASLLAVSWARWSADTANVDNATKPLNALLVGARWLRENHLARTILAAQLVQAFAGAIFFTGIAPHLQRNLGGGATTYGIQGAAYGAALILGSWAIGRRAVRRIGLLYAAGFIINGLGNSGFALATSLTTILPAAFVAGLGAAAFLTGETTLLQVTIPAAVRGRVIALTIVLATATGIVALALGGWLADRIDVRYPMLIASLTHIAIGGGLCATARLRNARTTEECEQLVG